MTAASFALEHPLPYGQSDPDAVARDQRYTPPWVTEGLLDNRPPPAGCRVLECAAGSGHIVRVLTDRGYQPHALELRGEELTGLVQLCPTTIGDWLRISRDPGQLYQAAGGLVQAIVTNPPFSIARLFATACLSVDSPYVALLMSVTTLTGSGIEWAHFWAAHPPTSVLPLKARPHYPTPTDPTPEGTDRVGACWWIWEAGKTPLDLVPVG